MTDNRAKTSPFCVTVALIAAFYLLSPLVESWFSRSQWADARIEDSFYISGSGEDASVVDTDAIAFFDADTGKRILAKCSRKCADQIGLVVGGRRYRLIISELPILGKRIMNIEYYDGAP